MRIPRFFHVLWAIAHKEFRHFWRDRGILRMVALMQLFDILVFGTMDFRVRDVPTVIVDQDRTADSRQLTERIAATGTFEVVGAADTADQASKLIRAGRVQAAIVVPPGYARTQLEGGDGTVLTIVDGTNAAVSDAVSGTMSGVAANLNALNRQATPAEGMTLRAMSLFNPQGRTSFYILPALFAILLADCYLLFGVFAMTAERDAGNLERLLMTPMSYSAFVIGKLLPWAAVGVANACLVLLTIRFGFGIPVRGSMWMLACGTTFFLLTVVAAGIFFGLGGGEEADTWGGYQSLAAFWLSGFIFPLASLPESLRVISYLLPQTHLIEIMRGACLRGAGFSDLLRPVLCLGLAPLLFIAAATYRLSRSEGT